MYLSSWTRKVKERVWRHVCTRIVCAPRNYSIHYRYPINIAAHSGRDCSYEHYIINTLQTRPTRNWCFSCLVFIYRSIIMVNCVNSAYCTPSASLSPRFFLWIHFIYESSCWSVGCVLCSTTQHSMYDVGVDFMLHFVCIQYRFSDWKNFFQ